MTKQQRVNFLKAYIEMYEAIDTLNFSEADSINDIYHKFLETEKLPVLSADELLQHITTAPFFGLVATLHPRHLTQEDWNLYEDEDLKTLYKCEDTGASYILTYHDEYVTFCEDRRIEGTREHVIKYLQEHL